MHTFLLGPVSSFQPLPSVLYLKNSHLELFLGPHWASKIAMHLALPLELCDYTGELPLPSALEVRCCICIPFFSITVGCSTSALARPCVLAAVTNRYFTGYLQGLSCSGLEMIYSSHLCQAVKCKLEGIQVLNT